MHKALKQHVYIEYFLCHGRAPQPVTPSHREGDPPTTSPGRGHQQRGPPPPHNPMLSPFCVREIIFM